MSNCQPPSGAVAFRQEQRHLLQRRLPHWIARLQSPARTGINFHAARLVALSQEVPAQDLLVSLQNRVLVRSLIAQRMFGAQEVLVAAAA